MQYVRTENGNIKAGENGIPLIKDDENSEPYELDATQLKSKVAELNEEAKKHRLSAKDLQKKLDQFEGIDDPQAAKDALEKVQNLQDKDIIDANKAEEMKKQIQDQYEQKLAEKDQELSERDKQIHNLVVSNAFSNSKVINEKTILPPDVAEAYFGKHFKVENGQAVAYDDSGNPIHSKEEPWKPAPFDEALDHLLERHPRRDQLLRGSPGGSGSASGSGAGGEKKISRTQFEQMTPEQQRKWVVEQGGEVTD